KKDREEYEELISKADALFRSKDLEEAMRYYYSASKHHLADAYPKSQAEKIKQQLALVENRERYDNVMKLDEQSDRQRDYGQARSYYQNASSMGVDSYAAERQASYMDQKIAQVKREQEQELKEKERQEELKQEELLKEQERQKEEAERHVREKEAGLGRRRGEPDNGGPGAKGTPGAGTGKGENARSPAAGMGTPAARRGRENSAGGK